MTLRVLVVDDQPLVREGLVVLLQRVAGLDIVGSADGGRHALALVASLHPDVVLLDLRMPDLDGVAVTAWITNHHPEVAVLALTTYADDRSLFAALRAGARGYLTKDATVDEIVTALRTVAGGATALAPQAQTRVVSAALRPERNPQPDRPDGLTPREREVLTLIAAGLRNEEIAIRLGIGTATVKTHVNNIFGKIGAVDRGQAVAYAYRIGLAQP
jgi:DNA-binding NarL/FixJ family response regulator